MTQEEKQLLLKDLCARLSYRTFAQWHHKALNKFRDVKIMKISTYGKNIDDYYINVLCQPEPGVDYEASIVDIKPYLRPMSSMTEEEKEEMHNLLSPEGTAIYENDGIALPINHCGEFVPYEFMNCIIQYLLKNHFDFMGLIPKGLAIEVTEENNPYKK